MIIGFIGRRGVGKDTNARALQVLQAGEQINEWMQYVTTGSDGGDTAPYKIRLKAPVIDKFAAGLKEMLAVLLMRQGLDKDTVREMIDGSLKEVKSAYLGGVTPRYAMQTLGTEWGRTHLGQSFWAESTVRGCSSNRDFLLTDARFPTESDAIRKAGGKLVKVRGFMTIQHWTKLLGIEWKDTLTPNELTYRLFDSQLLEALEVFRERISNIEELTSRLSHESESHVDRMPFDLEIVNTGTVASLLGNARELQYFLINSKKDSV